MKKGFFYRSTFARLKTFVGYLFSLQLYWLSFLIPRNSNIWVFGAWYGYRYADNSKHLFEYICQNEPSVKSVWLSRDGAIVDSVRDLGYVAYLNKSWQGYWYTCRAGVVFASSGVMDLNRAGISRAKRVLLFHGVPLKKIGLDNNIGINTGGYSLKNTRYYLEKVISFFRNNLFPFTKEKWDLIISTSPVVSERMASAYGVDPSSIVITGLPRNDILLSSNSKQSEVVKKIKNQLGVQKLILYAPTFRNQFEDNAKLFNDFNKSCELERCLSVHNAALLIKMHFVYRDVVMVANLDREKDYLYWLTEEEVPELNPLLKDIDILITDYSSIYFDYLLLNRPIIFTPFDLASYMTRDRQLYEKYEEATPGVKCNDWRSVVVAIDKIFSGKDDYVLDRKNAIKKYHTYYDDKSSSRVFQVANSLLNNSTK